MESRWHLPKGKKLDETKIEERGHALHVTKDNWGKVTGHLDRKKMISEAIEAEEAHRTYMKDASYAMTKNWDNSVENIRKRKEEQREAEYESTKDIMLTRFLELKKEQDEERKIYVDKMRKKMMQKKNYPSALNSALILSHVMHEREKQIELNTKIKEHEKGIEEEVARIKQEALDEIREKAEAAVANRKKNLEYADLLKKQMEVKKVKEKVEIEQRVISEAHENELAHKEMEMLKNEEFKKKMVTREKINSDLDAFKTMKQSCEEEIRKQEEKEESMNKLYQKSKDEIDCLRKIKAKEVRENRQKYIEHVGEKLVKARGEEVKLAKENACYEKAKAEKDAIDEARAKQEREKELKMIEDKKIEHLKFLKNSKELEKCKEEINKLEIANRYRAAEENKKYEINVKKAARERQMKACEILKKQIEERKLNNKEDDRLEFEVMKKSMKEEDEEFLTYAEEVKTFAKDHNLTTYPIDKVVNKYKKENMKEGMLRKCPHSESDLLNATPGKYAHDPYSDPNYVKSLCKCDCHVDPLYK